MDNQLVHMISSNTSGLRWLSIYKLQCCCYMYVIGRMSLAKLSRRLLKFRKVKPKTKLMEQISHEIKNKLSANTFAGTQSLRRVPSTNKY